VKQGGLLSYGPDLVDIVLRSASYIDKILRGAKPADLPVQVPVKFEMAVNVKTAKVLGLTGPPSIREWAAAAPLAAVASVSPRCEKRRSAICQSLSQEAHARCRGCYMVQCVSPLLAQSGHHVHAEPCPLSPVKRTSARGTSMSANDPYRTLEDGMLSDVRLRQNALVQC